MPLRIYADFNSGGTPGTDYSCWTLRYGAAGRPLDEVAEELQLHDGTILTLFYEDEAEELEVSAILNRSNDPQIRWHARPNWNSFRRIRG